MSPAPSIILGKRRGKNRRITQRVSAPERVRTALVGAKTMLALGLGIVALVVVAVGITYAWQAFRSSGRLKVRSVELAGNTRASARELEAYTGVRAGDAILDLDLDAVALQLRHHPWIESATVRRRLPDKVAIEVREFSPAIIVSLGDTYLADRDGVLFKRLSAADRVVLPVLTGLSREEAQKRPQDAAERIRFAVVLAQEIESQGKMLGRLDELHFDADLGWSLILARGDDELGLRVHLGTTPMARVAMAVAAQERLRSLGRSAAVIWADSIKNPNRVQVRLREASASSAAKTLIAKAR